MEYPWNILGIESTRDQKTIKHAYASILRANKPDEDPEGFRNVNDAYQYALNMLKQKQSNDEDTKHYAQNVTDVEIDATPDNDYEDINDSETGFHLSVATEKSGLYTEVLRLIDHKNYSLESWQFMSNHPGLLLDGIFLEQISYTIFQALLVELQQDIVFLKQTRSDQEKSISYIFTSGIYYAMKKSFLEIHKDLFLYFNSIFNWTSNWQKLEDQFSDTAMLVIKELEIVQNEQDGILNKSGLNQVTHKKEIVITYDFIKSIKEYLLLKFNAQKGTRRHDYLEFIVALSWLGLAIGLLLYTLSFAYNHYFG